MSTETLFSHMSEKADGSSGSRDQIFKDFYWYNSHSIPMEMQVGISRLEFPVDVIINKDIEVNELYLTAYILTNEIPMHEIPISTHYGAIDVQRNCVVWDYALAIPVRIRDLQANSVLVLNIYTANGEIFGGTTMQLFSEKKTLKRGKQKLIFYYKKEADATVLLNHNRTPGSLYDIYASKDDKFNFEKKLEAFNSSSGASASSSGGGDMSLNWLDKLFLNRTNESLSNGTSRSHLLSNDITGQEGLSGSPEAFEGYTDEEIDLHTYFCLIVEMPILPYKVLHEERVYQCVVPHNPLLDPINSGIGIEANSDGSVVEFTMTPNFDASSLSVVADWDVFEENLFEEQHRYLSGNIVRGTNDITIKPNLKEKENISKILSDVTFKNLSSDEMNIIYKFRYTLTDNKKALIKYLLSINWSMESEVSELPKLLSIWQPIDVADALKLLGRERVFEHPMVREYAVSILRSASDEELMTYLLQLVQGLRYERSISNTSTSSGNLVAEVAEGNGNNSNDYLSLSPLAQFLIERACISAYVANFLYWYLRTESRPSRLSGSDESRSENDPALLHYKLVFECFLDQLLKSGQQGVELCLQLRALDEYLEAICQCQNTARDLPGKNKEPKQELLKQLLAKRKLDNIPPSLVSVPNPLNPLYQINGLDPTSAHMFASAIYPAVISFYDATDLYNNSKDNISSSSSSNSQTPAISSEIENNNNNKKQLKIHQILFKSGDDLRQDQLIMQMINLMDNLLKKVNLDLKLHTYGILAISKDDGIMEFVKGSDPVSKILKEHKTLTNYLRHHNPDPAGPYEISSSALDNFVKSSAASCVVTYILGIGDRHLDNIMMRTSGQLFHIDFGFIFGQDPKPLPPPFRFTRHMADAMGGEESEHYKRFQSYCCQAYNWLRKSANLILNLLSLMADANINDISRRSSINKVLEGTLNKFRLDLTDEQAEHFFIGLISESLNAIAPWINEKFHQFAVARRG